MKERDVSFFRPLWRRVAVTAVCAGWCVLEFFGHDQTWILITLGLTAYAAWTFFLTFPKEVPMPVATTAPLPADTGENDVPPQS